ncbi:hypothetical protein ACFWXK_39450, partial [Streptomyces sp. NPDC059070]
VRLRVRAAGEAIGGTAAAPGLGGLPGPTFAPPVREGPWAIRRPPYGIHPYGVRSPHPAPGRG